MKSSDTALPIAAGALALLVSSCDTTSSASGDAVATASFVVPAPSAALTSRAIDRDTLDVAVTVGGRAASVSVGANGERRATIELPPGETLPVEVTWFDGTGATPVPLFGFSTEIAPVSVDGAVVRLDETYRELDSDDDGSTNVEELDAGRNPFEGTNADSFSEANSRGVRIPELPEGVGPPVIDGVYDGSGVWTESARFNDIAGDLLRIGNLLLDRGAEAADGEPLYRWFAVHDRESLYLAVLFEGARDDETDSRDDVDYTPVRDSERVSDDDALNLLFDGDNSRRRALDGVNDLYLQIPQVTADDDSGAGVTALRPLAPDPNAMLPGLEYASCVCRSGTSSWEVKIPLSLIDVRLGRPFGLEIQIDQDLDGADGDARWGWANPSIAERSEDYRFESPRFSGQAVLIRRTRAQDDEVRSSS